MAQNLLHKELNSTVHAHHVRNSPRQLPADITVWRMLTQTNLESQSRAAIEAATKALNSSPFPLNKNKLLLPTAF
jgi:hypothetical protein